jgi:hypothetical protein
MGKKSGSGSAGMNNPDHISESLKYCFLGLKYFNYLFDVDPGCKKSDPGWKKVGSGIRDKHPGSATQ